MTAFGLESEAKTPEHESRCEMVRDHVVFHAIFDFERPSSLPLLVNQVCRALRLCIAESNFRVVLHLERKRVMSKKRPGKILISKRCAADYHAAREFLTSLGISFTVWTGEFDTVSSQRARLVALRDLELTGHDTTRWVLQVDADEMPVFWPTSLSDILHQLQAKASTDGCDAVYGYLSERVSRDGTLRNISLSSTSFLDTQFPLLCNVKENVEKAQNRKLVLYRASFRAGIGNHRLICERKNSNSVSSTSSEVAACRKILEKRSDFVQLHPTIGSILPRRCDKSRDKIPTLDIEHFKYTWGLEAYLEKRVRVFRKNKLAWHSESSAVLNHMGKNGGKICVTCRELRCRNVTSRLAHI